MSVLSSVTYHAKCFDKKEKPHWAVSSIVTGYVTYKLPGKQEAA